MSTASVASRATSAAETRNFPLKAMVWGGLLAGCLDGMDAVVYFGITAGARPAGIFRYIAGGLIGLSSARAGGSEVVVLGVFLHFLIAMGAAASYCAASLWMAGLVRRPLLWGPAFGVAVYAFMDFIVVPLSLLPHQSHWSSSAVFANEIIIHMVGVGLPIALFAARSYKTEMRNASAPLVSWKD